MATKQIYVIVPLANDVNEDWTEVGPNFKKRCEIVSEIVENLRHYGKETIIMQAAGNTAESQGKPTLAELGAEYLKTLSLNVPIHYNQDDPDVWGTWDELMWVFSETTTHCSEYEVIVVFVTQKRHIPRVVTIAFFNAPAFHYPIYIRSGQTKEIPLLHEVRGFVAVFGHLCGFSKLIREIRRRVSLSFDRA